MTKIGRNDPCHCRSWKKYKKCHLAEDENRAAAARATLAAEALAIDDGPIALPPPTDLAGITGFLKKLSRTGLASGRAEFTQLLAETQPLFEYMERSEAIEAAGAALEAHREAFLKLTQDERAYARQAHELFADERFASLRFTADEVQRAFERVGRPAKYLDDDRTVEILRAAILHLADESRRRQMGMALLLHLPHYVAAGRFLDAWLIQECAYQTTETPDESNMLLFEMFSFGYDAWAAGQCSRDEALARELGLDIEQFRRMSPAEIDAWVQTAQTDPALLAKLETFMTADPGGREQSRATLEAMERDSVKLFGHDGAAVLLLAPEETEPWLPVINERLAGLMKRPSAPSDPAAPLDAASAKALGEKLWPLLGEMSAAIFTPARLRQLIARIKSYRDERFAAGDEHLVGRALGAVNSLEREDDPARNYFLNVLCFLSLRAMAVAPPPAAGG